MNTVEITETISVRVEEGDRVDLVYDSTLPPGTSGIEGSRGRNDGSGHVDEWVERDVFDDIQLMAR